MRAFRSAAVPCLILLSIDLLPRAQGASAPDLSWREQQPAERLRPADFAGVRRHSQFVQMRDGVRLAIDVWLPEPLPAGTRLPTIIEQTRYYRSSVLKSDPNGECRPAGKPGIDLFVTHGYAYVIVDVRGTGASFGTRVAEYSAAEIADGKEILDWVVRQAWSDGHVGSQGQSYLGTAAEFMAENHHPALKAVSPSFSGYDFYGEIISPGGIRNTAFGKSWSDAIQALDFATPAGSSPVAGPCPVDGDSSHGLLHDAVEQHRANLNVWKFLQHVAFRDDRFEGLTVDGTSPFSHQKAIGSAHVPFYVVVGWSDSAYALGAIRRLQSSSTAHMNVLIGPWGHGVRYFYAPGVREPTPSSFDLAGEKLRYFDYVLKGIDEGFSRAPRIRYFTTGSNRWHDAQQWPPPESRWRTLFVGADHGLIERSPGRAGAETYVSDGTALSGENNRWHSTMGAFPVSYPDRRAADERLLTYTSSALPADLELTGDPVVTLYMSTDQSDSDVFAYLEEVMPDGEVNYVTEGELRASRRAPGRLPFRTPAPVHSDRRGDAERVESGRRMKLEIGLLPLSHVFKAGSRLRIALASADLSQFQEHAAHAETWTLFHGFLSPSRIDLPVIERKP